MPPDPPMLACLYIHIHVTPFKKRWLQHTFVLIKLRLLEKLCESCRSVYKPWKEEGWVISYLPDLWPSYTAFAKYCACPYHLYKEGLYTDSLIGLRA